jgi:hypothetical protein
MTLLKFFCQKRIILSFDLILWYLKSLHMYTVIKRMGTKLIMIKKLSAQLAMFMLIVVLFMFAFGIIIQALTYHNLPPSWSLLVSVFMPPFFAVGGQFDNYISYLMCRGLFLLCSVKKKILSKYF